MVRCATGFELNSYREDEVSSEAASGPTHTQDYKWCFHPRALPATLIELCPQSRLS